MPRWKLLDHWDDDLAGLSDERLRERLKLARRHEASSLDSGPGRNPKAARDWRARRQAVEKTIARREQRT